MSRISRASLCAVLITTLSMNATLALAAPAPEELAERLAVNGEPMPVASVSETPLEGLFEVRLESGETFYSDAEGEHFIVGDLYANRDEGLVNLTQQSRNAERAERLAEIPEDRFVVFRGAEEPKAVIHVFTDATCPYCRKLHEEVPRLNDMGIEVKYLAFPRSGLNSQGARLLEQVWCADNPSEAMSAAKRGESLDAPADCDNPVVEQYHLGGELGVRGTPAIILPDGRLVPGYVPAERLAAMLGIQG
ncbi:thiol:disulfide interchange protein DsbC [Modicisalibacter muralis]|uniref:Thiol:disulfide interchange protein n=1 Tax=Modicisalibacter muralis TaxID=119000 RepID=A0A1G9Q858_9GAMM|nr:DsbC family protein [Halomonas muralis]SDM07252.1 thiol:disulfide interchange protein DsbC [Halomonas muralis]